MDKTQKSFEFRMSKKVAELTQVVHMLFTRNHEKEVEIEALKDAYEYEIQLVLEDAKQRISNLETKLDEAHSRADAEEAKWKCLMDDQIKTKEEEWKKKLSDNERVLQDERNECQNLRDLLINAQKDIELLRQGVSEQLTFKCGELCKRDKEIERLKKYVTCLEKTLKDSEKEASNAIREFEKSNSKLEQELTSLHELLEESLQIKEHLAGKNKQLEQDLKTMKKEFNRKVSEIVNNQNGRPPRSASSSNQNDELERLRKEVQRYRLELSNRDWNFNRMFTNQQPIFLDQRKGKTKNTKPPLQNQQNGYPQPLPPYVVSQSADGLQTSNSHSLPPTRISHTPNSIQPANREKTQITNGFNESHSPVSGSVSSTASNTRSGSSQSHLPLIGPTSASSDYKARLRTLAKPRPLSREALFGK